MDENGVVVACPKCETIRFVPGAELEGRPEMEFVCVRCGHVAKSPVLRMIEKLGGVLGGGRRRR